GPIAFSLPARTRSAASALACSAAATTAASSSPPSRAASPSRSMMAAGSPPPSAASLSSTCLAAPMLTRLAATSPTSDASAAAVTRERVLVARHRDEIGLGEVAVVVHFLLGAQRGKPVAGGVVVERLLHDLPSPLQDLHLARDLRADAALEEAEGVHVLQLRLRAQLDGAGRSHGDVGVAAQRALLHVHVADP